MRKGTLLAFTFIASSILVPVGRSSPVVTAHRPAPIYRIIDLGRSRRHLQHCPRTSTHEGRSWAVVLRRPAGPADAFLWEALYGHAGPVLGELRFESLPPLASMREVRLWGTSGTAYGPNKPCFPVGGVYGYAGPRHSWTDSLASLRASPRAINARGQIVGASALIGRGRGREPCRPLGLQESARALPGHAGRPHQRRLRPSTGRARWWVNISISPRARRSPPFSGRRDRHAGPGHAGRHRQHAYGYQRAAQVVGYSHTAMGRTTPSSGAGSGMQDLGSSGGLTSYVRY